jgi:N6-L-threonylcarbamoyladenine synthase
MIDTVAGLILGIESSCDETAAAVVEPLVRQRALEQAAEVDERARVLSSVIASQVELHREYAGVVPEIASRAHVERMLPTIREALAQAGVGLGRIDAIAVGNRPGLIGCLLVGVAAAKGLAWALGKPLVGIDHVAAHLYSGLLVDQDDPVLPGGAVFPALGLVVSGGHTSLYYIESWGKVKRLGATIDDALGEAYDKVAAILGVPYPGGPNIDSMAQRGDDRRYQLPISRLGHDSLQFSFSGLKTAVLYAAKGVPGRRDAQGVVLTHPEIDERGKLDLAASFQRAACAAVSLKINRALALYPDVKTLLTGGGVTANSRLRKELTLLANQHNITLSLPKMRYCVDNAAMIAGLASRVPPGVEGLMLQADPVSGLR